MYKKHILEQLCPLKLSNLEIEIMCALIATVLYIKRTLIIVLIGHLCSLQGSEGGLNSEKMRQSLMEKGTNLWITIDG